MILGGRNPALESEARGIVYRKAAADGVRGPAPAAASRMERPVVKGNDLIRHGFAVPPSPKGKAFGGAQQRNPALESVARDFVYRKAAASGAWALLVRKFPALESVAPGIDTRKGGSSWPQAS